MKKMETPQEYINRIVREMPNGSHVKVAKLAQKLGHKLSAGFVHNVASGVTDNPGVKSIKALAAGLMRPEDEVFAVFRGKQLAEEVAYQEGGFAVIWSVVNVLPKEDQKELRPMFDMLRYEALRRLK